MTRRASVNLRQVVHSVRLLDMERALLRNILLGVGNVSLANLSSLPSHLFHAAEVLSFWRSAF